MLPLVSLVSLISNPLSLSLLAILLAFALLQIAFPDPPTLADCLRYAFVLGMAYLTGSLFLRVVVQPEVGEGDCGFGVGVGDGGGGAAEGLGVGEDAGVGHGDGGRGGEEGGSQPQQEEEEVDEDLKIPGSFLHDSPQTQQLPPLRDGPSHRHRHHQHRHRRSSSSSETSTETPLATERRHDKKQKRHGGEPEDARARARSRGGEEESLIIPATPLGGALHPSGLMGASPVGRG
ncbi:hypothetical protein BS50DRAFT_592958 [Corynespora cassiicola Philippines]|uniref:Uncharacterized protein n=1 Tax=Corynespora cassiicola Philippines TaxID=1448308 RepID=A0A2T2N7V6_CORCC|nr:hypothetical protein BS50DRAFT_592958 [Corynespora cassiicola Philippines]